jgi:hypothetical protein
MNDAQPDEAGRADDGADAQSRREFLLRIAKGVTYSAPVIYSFAAPSAATAQTSGAPMMTICDYFPALCRWLGGNETSTFTVAPGLSDPGAAAPPTPGLPTAPWSKPPPWGGP